MKRYEDIDTQIIIDKWIKHNDPFGVYVHSPFCPSICKFCIYAGVKHNVEKFNDYYDNYLPKVIEFYKPILEQKTENINNWFFGGGTPSLIPPDKLKNLFNSLPNFKNHKAEKTFELHPGAFHIEQLDVLKEYNFDIVILCQQTLDQLTLKNQNRVESDLDTLIFLSEECKKRNLKTGLDIIAFLNKKESDVEILYNDLKLTYEYIKPDQLSVQCLYQEKGSVFDFNHKTFDTLMNSDYITKKDYLIEHLNPFDVSDADSEVKLANIKKEYETLKCLRLYKKDSDIKFNCVSYMDPAWFHGFSKKLNSTLALGSYKNPFTQTHSNINEFNYIEVNRDNKIFKLKYVSSSYIEEMEFLLSVIKQVGEPPKNLTYVIKTSFYEENQIPLFLDFEIRTEVDNEDAEIANYLNMEFSAYLNEFYNVLNFEKANMLDRLKDKNYQSIKFIY